MTSTEAEILGLGKYFEQYASDDENEPLEEESPLEEGLRNFSEDEEEETDVPLVSMVKPEIKSRYDRRGRSAEISDALVVLFRRGVASVPVADAKKTLKIRKDLLVEASRFPEYLNPANPKTEYVLGGFGALGNPASFHNPTVRNNRLEMMNHARPLFEGFVQVMEEIARGDFNSISNARADKMMGGELTEKSKKRLQKSCGKIIKSAEKYAAKFPNSTWLIEQVPDRMLIRRPGAVFKGEDWHQDTSPFTSQKRPDIIFGGWVGYNPESYSERFTYSSGSHSFGDRPYSGVKTGFKTLKDLQKADVKEYKTITETRKTTQTVKPGHWCVFPQNIVHMVNPSSEQDFNILRQFFGFRVTFGVPGKVKSLHHNVELQKTPAIDFKQDVAIARQGPFPQPSGEISRMYPRQLASTGLYKILIPWSVKTFKPVCLETKRIQKRTGTIPKEVKEKLPKKSGKDALDVKSPEYKEAKAAADLMAEKRAIENKLPPAGSEYRVVQVWMKPLQDLGLPMYKAYSKQELDILRPLPLLASAFGKEDEDTESDEEMQKLLEEQKQKQKRGQKRPRAESSGEQGPAKKPRTEQKEEITPTPQAT